MHVVHAVAKEDCALGTGAQELQCLEHRLRMRLGVHHVIDTHQFLEVRRKAGEVEAAQRALAVLAGDERSAMTGRPDFLQHFGDAVVERHHRVVVGKVVLAVGSDQLLDLAAPVVPVGKLYPERGADPTEPVIIGPRGNAVDPERVVIAVQDQLHRVDQGAVEIEQQGVVARHGRQTYPVLPGTEARHRE